MTLRLLHEDALASARRTIDLERDGIDALRDSLDDAATGRAFGDALALIGRCAGKLVVTGIGKSGIVGRKIAATMNSTGTPSVYLHPGDAIHGDLGLITAHDVVLALTWSGETKELVDIFAHCRRLEIPLIVMTSVAKSRAAAAADVALVLPDVREACPNRLAPTSSTTVQMVMGDALSLALVEDRGFSTNDFLKLHPGGALGWRSMTVARLMGTGDDVPRIGVDATIVDATVEMSRKRYGSTAVVDDAGRILGAFTDGDLRRCFTAHPPHTAIAKLMSHHPATVRPTALASYGLQLMNDSAISMLFVCEEDGLLVGALHLHDVVRAGRG